jgi:hypothetical protein
MQPPRSRPPRPGAGVTIKHRVKAGETLDSIALEYGHLPDTVWLHADNTALRNEREDCNVLLVGDEVVIPDKDAKKVPASTGATHRYRQLGVPTKFSLHLVEDGEPIAHEAYRLDIDGSSVEGTTDAEGFLEEFVPHEVKQAVLVLGTPPNAREFDVQVGVLDPVEEVTGVQGRLHSLGFDCGEIDGEFGERTRQSLIEFQKYIDHPEPEGVLDEDTRKALDALHEERQGGS